MYAGRQDLLRPIIFGGSQEHGLRGGTHNTPYIVGMGRAAEIASEKYLRSVHSYKARINEITRRILEEVPGAHINGTPHSSSKIVNIRFDGVDGETLLFLLDVSGVEVSAGSACSGHYAAPSHVLSALGLTENEAKSSIRISVSECTTTDEITEAAGTIIDSVKLLRGN